MTTKTKKTKKEIIDMINHEVPYSEMTDEEIEQVIEIKAEVKARENVYREMIAEWNKRQDDSAKKLDVQNAKMFEKFLDVCDTIIAKEKEQKIAFEESLIKNE